MQIVQQKQLEQQQHQYHQTPYIKHQAAQQQPQQPQQNPFQQLAMQAQQVQSSFQQQQTQMNNSNFNPNTAAAPNFFTQLASQKAANISPITGNNFQMGQAPSASPANFFQQATPTVTIQSTPNGFGNNGFANGQSAGAGVASQSTGPTPYFSNLSELSEQDMREFNSAQFTMGKIPRNPPPQNLC